MCLFGLERPPKRKRKSSRLWSPDGSPDAPARLHRSSTLSTSPLLPSQMVQVRLPDQRYLSSHPSSQPVRPARIRRRGSHRRPRSPSMPSSPTNAITAQPAAMSYHYRRPSQPISFQRSLLSPPPTSPPPPYAYGMAANEPWRSSTNLASPVYASRNRTRMVASSTNIASSLAGQLHQAAESVTNLDALANQDAGFYDRISARLNEVISEIDNEIIGNGEYVVDPFHQVAGPQRAIGPVAATRQLVAAASGSTVASTSFSKVWLYANSRLPPYLPPLKVYMPTYPLLCLAAQYSLRVYDKPTAREREDHIKASLWHRTKAMTLKSLPMDDMNTIVFAIRGSSSFTDWAVNFRPAPSPPDGFLDDPGNLCHAGFLCIAKGMIKPVAARLRTLLVENPGRSASSLVITGHSAGGAVAQLLYAHMLSKNVDSELNYLAGFFKRVHCITFGTPPVSLLPLATPKSRQNRKSLFFSFVNEGDPVARADKAVVRSLLKLYATPAPSSSNMSHSNQSRIGFKWTKPTTWSPDSYIPSQPIWPVPNATLSLGGRIILLRPKFQGTGVDDVEAVTISDELLRESVFGDPACHTMTMYAKRIEILATQAVTVGGFH